MAGAGSAALNLAVQDMLDKFFVHNVTLHRAREELLVMWTSVQDCLSDDDFSVHLRPGGEFLVHLANPRVRARVAERPVRAHRFRLLSQPWGRSAGTEPLSLRLRVDIEISGTRVWHELVASLNIFMASLVTW
ncbi:uncharacterized protein LOC119303113 [Triticum dicoccoides]|uniref:uncharacterized protein LOC119303113 n=1 Tax=Triticum dicoccoides TaxID=85692 RepID=UPI00188F25C1|nr:uncharacterized protein LOC119303113 [Triticum dicoccoides]